VCGNEVKFLLLGQVGEQDGYFLRSVVALPDIPQVLRRLVDTVAGFIQPVLEAGEVEACDFRCACNVFTVHVYLLRLFRA